MQFVEKYIRYELHTRKYSSDCIKGIYIYLDENGKSHEKYDLVIVPVLSKKEGDLYALRILNFLNSSF